MSINDNFKQIIQRAFEFRDAGNMFDMITLAYSNIGFFIEQTNSENKALKKIAWLHFDFKFHQQPCQECQKVSMGGRWVLCIRTPYLKFHLNNLSGIFLK
jgi:hypothetical protein